MKSNDIRILCAAILCAASITACTGGTDSIPQTDTVTSSHPTAEETTAPTVLHNVPDTLDFSGETLNLLYCPVIGTYNINQTEDTGENVETAIYEANHAVMEYLNCSFAYIEGGVVENNLMKNSLLADDNAFDAAFAVQWLTTSLIPDGMLCNLNDAPYLELDRPWWYVGYNEEAAAPDGQKYMLAGDLNLNTLRKASVLVMNTDLMADMDIDSTEVIGQVLDGTWTWDTFDTMARSIYTDINGNSARDADDTYGIACTTRSIVDHMLVNSGIRMTERNSDNIPTIIFNNEKTVSSVENITALFHDNIGMFYEEGCSFTTLLSENRVLFLPVLLSSLEGFRNIETNYAVIPMPKLDETVVQYSALVHDDTTILCVPANCEKTELTFAAMELLAYEGYTRVMPQYYEVSMKEKYLRGTDSTAVQLIDLIHDSVTTDYGYVYNHLIGEPITGLRDCAVKNGFQFASYYASREKRVEKLFAELLSTMEQE
ncbi:MAG: hypothetical protein IJ302_09405 [Clostridia bacterium]|nr:hypothetical protein [Clostridia bacterium]